LRLRCHVAAPHAAACTARSLRYCSQPYASQFGFEAGGTVRLDVTLFDVNGTALSGNVSQGLFILGCEARWRSTTRRAPALLTPPQAGTHDTISHLLSSGHCVTALAYARLQCPLPPAAVVAVKGLARLALYVPVAATLTLTFLKCEEDEVDAVGVDYWLLNPGGQNLSTSQAPLPPTYLAFTLVWLLLAALYARQVRARGGRAGGEGGLSGLQTALLSVPATKALCLAVATGKWWALDRSGREDRALDVSLAAVLTASQTDLVGVLLLLSRSWQLSRSSLGAPERNALLLSLLLLASLFFVYSLWSPRSSFYALSLAYLAVLAFAFASTSHGLRHLRAQAALLRLRGAPEEAAAARLRVDVFNALHAALALFLAAQVVLHLVTAFVLDAQQWLNALFAELADLGVALVVGAAYRPRRPSPYAEDESADEALRAAASSIIGGRGAAPLSASDEELTRVMEALRAREQARAREPPRAAEGEREGEAPLPVLVENPCGFDAEGRRVVSVAVGLPQEEPKPDEPPAELELATLFHANPLAERPRLTETQPEVGDAAPGPSSADRLRLLWGAPGYGPLPPQLPPPLPR